MRLCTLALLAAFTPFLAAQTIPASALEGLSWRSIGPATTGGRIADFAVAEVPGEPEVMYVGTASGGVFKSANAGVSWTPVFDHADGAMLSIGAVAVAPSNPSILWVGTGEVDNRQSSSWGNGIYKSLDGGATWHAMGLADSRHIAKILIDPHDANTVYVAALGHLWGSNSERGVYKTIDGGAHWVQVLKVNENTGATDLAMSPANPNLIFAAMYQRQRRGWGFNGGGPGSGLYRSSDGGATWTELSHGLPAGDKGRIGVAVFPGDPRIVYAIIEADPAGGGRGGRGGPAPALKGGVFRSTDEGQTWEHMSGLNPRPSYYSRIYVDPRDPDRVYIMGSERGFYISDDAGRNFRDVFSQVHGEDHALWIDPADPNHLLVGGDGGVSISMDRGLTWLFRDNLPIGQFYDISVNHASPMLVCGGLQDNGNWCTPTATRLSYGLSNRDAFNIGGGDGMQAVFDGDDSTLLVSSQNGSTNRLTLPNFQRQNIGPVLSETQPAPGAGRGAGGYRWYWTAPLIVSHADAKVIYTGANVLFRSEDQGASWTAISPDLTGHVDRDKLEMMGAPIPARALSKNDGQDNFSALTVIAESPLDAKVLYTGADDGTIEGTRDGGGHWSKLAVAGLPAMTNVSGIVASRYVAGRVYASFDGHFNDDYRAYVFVSEDFGQTWKPISDGLPTSVHRVRENPSDANFLVAATEAGLYASWDRGGHWTSLNTNLPPVPVYDLVYADGGLALVLGTHGRGIWVLDDTAPLLGMGRAAPAAAPQLFLPAPAHRTTIYSPQAWFGVGEFFAPNPPQGAALDFYLPEASAREATVTVKSGTNAVRHFNTPIHAGLNQAMWDLHYGPASTAPTGGFGGGGGRGGASGPWAPPGTYAVSVEIAGQPALTTNVVVTSDPESPISPAAQPEREAKVVEAYRLEQALEPARQAEAAAQKQLDALRAYLTALDQSPEGVQQASRALAEVNGELNRAITTAAAAERGMDGYEGMPSAAQLRQLGWAHEDAAASVAALNKFLAKDLPAEAAAAKAKPKWPAIAPVPVPKTK